MPVSKILLKKIGEHIDNFLRAIPPDEYSIRAITKVIKRLKAGYAKTQMRLTEYRIVHRIRENNIEAVQNRLSKDTVTEADLIDCAYYIIREIQTFEYYCQYCNTFLENEKPKMGVHSCQKCESDPTIEKYC